MFWRRRNAQPTFVPIEQVARDRALVYAEEVKRLAEGLLDRAELLQQVLAEEKGGRRGRTR